MIHGYKTRKTLKKNAIVLFLGKGYHRQINQLLNIESLPMISLAAAI